MFMFILDLTNRKDKIDTNSFLSFDLIEYTPVHVWQVNLLSFPLTTMFPKTERCYCDCVFSQGSRLSQGSYFPWFSPCCTGGSPPAGGLKIPVICHPPWPRCSPPRDNAASRQTTENFLSTENFRKNASEIRTGLALSVKLLNLFLA